MQSAVDCGLKNVVFPSNISEELYLEYISFAEFQRAVVHLYIMSEEIVLPVDSAQAESVLSENVSILQIESTPEIPNGNSAPATVQPKADVVNETEPKAEEAVAIKSSVPDTNLIDIINSMEEDRKKFIAHVHNKIASQESEFEVEKIN